MTINKKSILIVEDNRSLLSALVDKFKMEGFHVTNSTNGKKGLEIAIKSKPDLILLDILMPVMDGMTMLEILRKKNGWGKKVPVVILTNVEPNNDIAFKIVKDVQTYYLVKSDFKIQEVVDKVKEILS